jgi:hypothetical protein
MIFSENRLSPAIESGAGFFGIMLQVHPVGAGELSGRMQCKT